LVVHIRTDDKVYIVARDGFGDWAEHNSNEKWTHHSG